MTIKVRGRVPTRGDGRFTETEAAHIAERLRALEKAAGGGGEEFVAPGTPLFGSGPIVAPGGGGGGGGGGTTTPGVTDHGLLTGLDDDDHPQYVQHEERVLIPHTHTSGDVLDLDTGEGRATKAHAHVMRDVADLSPDDDQFVLAARIFGG